ncbi:MAG TPA: lysylphosphatidylglycerol synthase transmembrane domain-containing protein, partial [Chloroflexota bacterium]|nr:lysylphosphatidylglycerol synthase transmembrane domain-containing protein [Chloroflexota bacterium]
MSGKTLRFLIPFVISAALLILVVRSLGDEVSQLPAALGKADWRLIPPAIALYFAGVWLRSARWGLLLPEHVVRTTTLFRALVVGFTVNNLLPLRMGEVARAYLLARWCRIPYGATVASLLVERVLDGLSLAVLLLVSLALIPAPGYLLLIGFLAAAISLACLGLLALAAWRASAVTAVASFFARFLPARLGHVLIRVAATLARSLSLVHDPVRLVRLVGLSLLAWCFELGLFFVLLISFGLPASYPLALLVGSASNFATLLPSSPGYAGTFDGALIKVLQDTAAIATSQALAYDVVVHVTLFLPVVIVGMLVLWRAHVSFDQITHTPDRSA